MDTVISLLAKGAATASGQLPDIRTSKYGYRPTKYVCVIFVVLFTLSLLLHGGYAIRYRLAWTIPTFILGSILEILGWAARLWSSSKPWNGTPYKMQIVATIIGPTPFLAGIFMTFGSIVRIIGPEYSRMSPTMYSYLFVSFDVVSLVVQGVGGGLAAAAKTLEKADKGGNIMLGGISLQLAIISIFIVISTEFLVRLFTNKPYGKSATRNRPFLEHNMLIMITALYVTIGFLLIRGVYRVIELADGWHGDIIRTEVWFNVFDGAMVVLAFFMLIFVHPAVFLGKDALGQKPVSLRFDGDENSQDRMQMHSMEK